MLAEVSSSHSNPRRHPQAGGVGHENQGDGTENGPHQKVGPPSAQRPPGIVAEVADNGLHNQPRERSC